MKSRGLVSVIALGCISSGVLAEESAQVAEPKAAPKSGGYDGVMERGWWWDANFEGGVGTSGPNGGLWGMGRARVGVMYMTEPWYLSLGPTYEYSGFSAATFG